ncbi:hypothetical protein [Actinacidiphila sp. bgisy167]|uniref:hypothetical protein n=1 Tax=Actinacidiphila sp. bgisy167 TaxID=3413797 RepID=UPI003D73EB4F
MKRLLGEKSTPAAFQAAVERARQLLAEAYSGVLREALTATTGHDTVVPAHTSHSRHEPAESLTHTVPTGPTTIPATGTAPRPFLDGPMSAAAVRSGALTDQANQVDNAPDHVSAQDLLTHPGTTTPGTVSDPAQETGERVEHGDRGRTGDTHVPAEAGPYPNNATLEDDRVHPVISADGNQPQSEAPGKQRESGAAGRPTAVRYPEIDPETRANWQQPFDEARDRLENMNDGEAERLWPSVAAVMDIHHQPRPTIRDNLDPGSTEAQYMRLHDDMANVVAEAVRNNPGTPTDENHPAYKISEQLSKAFNTRPTEGLIGGAPKPSARPPLPTRAVQLIQDLRNMENSAETQLSVPGSLGVDHFGILHPAPVPDMLINPETDIAYDYSRITAGQWVFLLESMDMTGLKADPAIMNPRKWPSFNEKIYSYHREDLVWSDAPNVPRLASRDVETPALVQAIWFGDPLVRDGYTASFWDNYGDAARRLGDEALFVLWTDISRADLDRVRASGPQNEWEARLHKMTEWALSHNIALVNVHEVFNEARPMQLHYEFMTEMAKQSGPGWAAASDILRLEVMSMGGMYSDGDNVISSLAGLWQVTHSTAGYAIGHGEAGVGNAAFAAHKGHPLFDLQRNFLKGHYSKSQKNLYPPEFRERPKEWFAEPRGMVVRNSVMRRSGPDSYRELTDLLGLRYMQDMPAIEGLEVGYTGSWVVPATAVPKRSYTRPETVEFTARVVHTLLRGLLANRPGDLDLVRVNRAVTRHPDPDLVWQAALGYISSREDLRSRVTGITRTTLTRNRRQTELQRIALPPAAEALFTEGRHRPPVGDHEGWWAGDQSEAVTMLPPSGTAGVPGALNEAGGSRLISAASPQGSVQDHRRPVNSPPGRTSQGHAAARIPDQRDSENAVTPVALDPLAGLNPEGPLASGIRAMHSLAQRAGLASWDVRPDGNCFFYSVLSILAPVQGGQRELDQAVQGLRNQLADYLESDGEYWDQNEYALAYMYASEHPDRDSDQVVEDLLSRGEDGRFEVLSALSTQLREMSSYSNAGGDLVPNLFARLYNVSLIVLTVGTNRDPYIVRIGEGTRELHLVRHDGEQHWTPARPTWEGWNMEHAREALKAGRSYMAPSAPATSVHVPTRPFRSLPDPTRQVATGSGSVKGPEHTGAGAVRQREVPPPLPESTAVQSPGPARSKDSRITTDAPSRPRPLPQPTARQVPPANFEGPRRNQEAPVHRDESVRALDVAAPARPDAVKADRRNARVYGHKEDRIAKAWNAQLPQHEEEMRLREEEERRKEKSPAHPQATKRRPFPQVPGTGRRQGEDVWHTRTLGGAAGVANQAEFDQEPAEPVVAPSRVPESEGSGPLRTAGGDSSTLSSQPTGWKSLARDVYQSIRPAPLGIESPGELDAYWRDVEAVAQAGMSVDRVAKSADTGREVVASPQAQAAMEERAQELAEQYWDSVGLTPETRDAVRYQEITGPGTFQRDLTSQVESALRRQGASRAVTVDGIVRAWQRLPEFQRHLPLTQLANHVADGIASKVPDGAHQAPPSGVRPATVPATGMVQRSFLEEPRSAATAPPSVRPEPIPPAAGQRRPGGLRKDEPSALARAELNRGPILRPAVTDDSSVNGLLSALQDGTLSVKGRTVLLQQLSTFTGAMSDEQRTAYESLRAQTTPNEALDTTRNQSPQTEHARRQDAFFSPEMIGFPRGNPASWNLDDLTVQRSSVGTVGVFFVSDSQGRKVVVKAQESGPAVKYADEFIRLVGGIRTPDSRFYSRGSEEAGVLRALMARSDSDSLISARAEHFSVTEFVTGKSVKEMSPHEIKAFLEDERSVRQLGALIAVDSFIEYPDRFYRDNGYFNWGNFLYDADRREIVAIDNFIDTGMRTMKKRTLQHRLNALEDNLSDGAFDYAATRISIMLRGFSKDKSQEFQQLADQAQNNILSGATAARAVIGERLLTHEAALRHNQLSEFSRRFVPQAYTKGLAKFGRARWGMNQGDWDLAPVAVAANERLIDYWTSRGVSSWKPEDDVASTHSSDSAEFGPFEDDLDEAPVMGQAPPTPVRDGMPLSREEAPRLPDANLHASSSLHRSDAATEDLVRESDPAQGRGEQVEHRDQAQTGDTYRRTEPQRYEWKPVVSFAEETVPVATGRPGVGLPLDVIRHPARFTAEEITGLEAVHAEHLRTTADGPALEAAVATATEQAKRVIAQTIAHTPGWGMENTDILLTAPAEGLVVWMMIAQQVANKLDHRVKVSIGEQGDELIEICPQ